MRHVYSKGLALILSLMILTSNLVYPSSVSAFDRDNYIISKVILYKIYDTNRQLEESKVEIYGQYLKDATVGIVTSTGYTPLSNCTVNSDGLLQFVVSENQIGKSLIIEGLSIDINEGDMPTLTGVNRKVREGIDDLVIQGTNLTNIRDNPALEAGYEHIGAYMLMDKEAFNSDSTATIEKPQGTLGLQNIIFNKNETETYEIRTGVFQDITVSVKYTYKDQFRLVQELDIPDLEMRPNRGEAGEKVFFEADQLDLYDVFFLKNIDGTDAYTNSNKGKNPTFNPVTGGKDVLTVEVPNIPVGEYYVVLTNRIAEDSDPMTEVVQEKIVGTLTTGYDRFTVIDSNLKAKILDVQPNSGPDTGSRVTISGQFLGTLNIPEYKPIDQSITVKEPDENNEELVVTYAEGTYKGETITKAERKIKVIIGSNATFLTVADGSHYDVSFTEDLDTIVIQTATVTDADVNPVKDVVIETETTFTRDDKPDIVIIERAQLLNGYTYISSKIKPAIESINPNKIQVVPNLGKYEIPEERLIAIHGGNFLVNKYKKTDGTEVTNYPIVELGEVVLNKNLDSTIKMQVFTADGRLVDGTENNELGTKILVTIPSNIEVNTLGKTFLRVINPVRNSDNPGLSDQKNDFIEFVNPLYEQNPIITLVKPDVVTVDGGETIVIEGSNFTTGVVVFLDGEQIDNITRQEDGKKITFIAPKGREGETQLQVMNPEGGMATWPFTYVKTYTNPKITDFSPKKGNTGTLVIIKGENFLKPDPAAGNSNILKLIGTRVMLEDIEVNEYYRENNSISLQNYVASTEVLKIVDDTLQIADWYNAVIYQVEGDPNTYYTLDVNAKGEIILSDGINRNYTLTLVNEKITAVQDEGDSYELTVNNNSLILNGETLIQKTLYKVDSNNEIVGCRVKVLDRNTIYVLVPPLEVTGYYDVKIINPDTKSDIKKDEQGFYYYEMPTSKPEIISVYPNEGSVQGGYEVLISGKEFEEVSTGKARVFVYGIEIPEADTVISPSGDAITVKMPAFPGDLREITGSDHLTVPIVVVNPDGGTASKEDGFTYVVPSSHPQISKIVPQKGSASGGQVVEITGTDFRFFEPYEDVNRNQILDLGETFTDLNSNGKWDSESNISEWSTTKPLDHSIYSQYYDSPVLPQIYFGRNKGKIVEFARGYLKVITPASAAGTVKVYVVNNDSGVSNQVDYTYEASNPTITKIVPGQGKKQGGENVEIFGAGFYDNNFNVLKDGIIQEMHMPLVQFGDISNLNSDREIGRIDSGTATVELDGGLRAEYRATGTIKVILTENNETYELVYDGYDDKELYIDLSSLVSINDSTKKYWGNELIQVKIEDRRLIVQRGFSPQASLVNSTQMVVNTPSYYTVGIVPVTIYNPDGAIATYQFEYKNPASTPKITSITRDSVAPEDVTINGKNVRLLKINYKAESIVSIFGEDFRENASILIGDFLDINPEDINYSLPDKLSFTMPVIDESQIGKLHRVVVINEDGGIASSDQLPSGQNPIYIEFTKGETAPEITAISPTIGPVAGGTVVQIEGKDFRAMVTGYEEGTPQVYFGEQKTSQVEVVDYKTIRVVSPVNEPGLHPIRVENPDGEVSTPGGDFQYISSPKVTAVVSATDPTENLRLKTISVEGGQEIKIKGSGFMDGAKVVFVPVTSLAQSDDSGEIIYRISTKEDEFNGQKYTSNIITYHLLESGIEGKDVKWIDGETLTVKVPEGKLNSKGLIVVNPDKGASETYDDITYTMPELEAPLGVSAEIVHDKYNDTDMAIKVTWTEVSKAWEYEIYVLEDDQQMEYIGSTKLNSYMYEDLTPYTDYKFIVKAVGEFGSSKPSAESNTVTTGRYVGIPDTDGGLNDNTQLEKKGTTAYVKIGSDEYKANLLIDLTRGELAGSDKVIISLPARVISDNRYMNIDVKGKDFAVKFTPAIFDIAKVNDNWNKDDAGVKMVIQPARDINSSLASGVSSVYDIRAYFYQGTSNSSIDYLASNISLIMDYDVNKVRMRRFRYVLINRFDPYTDQWQPLNKESYLSGSTSVIINRMGRYTVIGGRN